MEFSDWDWEKEGRDVNEYLRAKESDDWLTHFFSTTTPTDLDDIVRSLTNRAKSKKKAKKKVDDNRIQTLMDKYNLSCYYIIEEFIVDNDIIDPDDKL